MERHRQLRDSSAEVVFWTHLGLGDQISASCLIESWLSAGCQLHLPVKPRNFDFLNAAYGNLEGLSLHIINDENPEKLEVADLAKKLVVSEVVEIGHSHLPIAKILFPEVFLNGVFNIIGGLTPDRLVSQRLRGALVSSEQNPVPEHPFAFVDHHPGTIREIPSNVLESVRDRGLRIFENPRDVPLQSLLAVMDSADELHMVPSAPLCMAMTVDAQSKQRFHYDHMGDSIEKNYRRWTSSPLPGASDPNFKHFEALSATKKGILSLLLGH